MLKNITIKNIALIRSVSIDLERGLNVLSGETGAGKSLIIDSISLLLGLKADKTLISSGEQEASVLAVFEISEDSPVCEYLQDMGIDDPTTIMIFRKINTAGKNECKVNGIPFSLSMLKALSSKLLDLHGQFDHQSLLKPQNHIGILDRYIPDKIVLIKSDLEKLINERLTILDSLKEYAGSDQERAQTIDFLKYAINEIENSNIYEGEESELKDKRSKIINQEKILNHITSAINYIDSNNYSNVENSISSAIGELNSISSLDENINSQLTRLESIKYDFSDIVYEINNIKNSYDFDPSYADEIEDRLEFIRLLKKKYGNSYNEIMDYLEKAKEKLEKLESSDEIINKLNIKKSDIEKSIFDLEDQLSIERQKNAKQFENAVLKELRDLGMGGSTFVVDFKKIDNRISINGYDDVEFLLSTNFGEPVKPLSKIISGGEMSRFMLGIKNITASLEKIDTMIFDEIDTGISGKMGRVTAEKLASISRDYQVICVSHLPQIAAMSDYNYFISKSKLNNRTETSVKQLDYDGKVREVARLSGGDENSNSSIMHAKDLINASDNYKEKIV